MAIPKKTVKGIPSGYRTNFHTMLKAAGNGDLALMECQDNASKKKVYVVCMVGRENGQYIFTPVAKMFDGNPYEEVNPPDPGDPSKFVTTEEAC
jgi:hypothetical protein